MSRRSAFTLIELSIVLLVLALLAGAAMRYANALNENKSVNATNTTLDAVETALLNYRTTYGRLPCPADITQAENTAAFGIEVGTQGDGNCTGYNFINATDPDGPTGNCGVSCDPGNTNPDPQYDSATLNQVVAGAIPTKVLKIPDRYAYDAWGNKIYYAVDKRITASNAFSTYSVGNTVVGAVVVKKAATDTLANAITYKALYTLVSAGKNGHGAYVRNLTATSVRANAGSANADEQDNCHCNSSAVATSFNRIFVQKPKTIDSSSTNDNFDDIVRFKLRSAMATTSELQ